MQIVMNFFTLIGGVTVFMLGLRLISQIEKLVTKSINSLMKKATSNRLLACSFGAVTTAVAQSSVATNIVAISFVNAGAITLESACALVIGTNFGTTMTAQLISLKFVGGIDVTAIGSIVAFVGLLVGTLNSEKLKVLGDVMLGFGLVFIGIDLTSSAIEVFKQYAWFRNIFLIKSAPILLLNGFFVTALCQSSSAVTGMLVVLASGGLVSFSSGAYMIMGANIGSCIAVIVSSSKKSLESKRVAWFNLYFNIFGSLLFFMAFMLFGNSIEGIFNATAGEAARRLANFHSFFNLASGLIVLMILKPFVKFTKWAVRDNSNSTKISSRKPIEIKKKIKISTK